MPDTIQPVAPPAALLRREADLPFVPFSEGVSFQLLQVNIEAGYWVVRARFEPGTIVQKHKHTGEVFAFTHAGSWKYLEYPEINLPGSFLYEPAGSIHTLHVLDDNEGLTDASFVVFGANLNYDENDQIERVLDAEAVLALYLAACSDAGLPRPDVMGA